MIRRPRYGVIDRRLAALPPFRDFELVAQMTNSQTNIRD